MVSKIQGAQISVKDEKCCGHTSTSRTGKSVEGI
jgi:hypothetical protein